MKIKNTITVLLIAIILASCAPVAQSTHPETAIPPTTIPTTTVPAVTLTPTIVPTEMPTSVPMIEIDGYKILEEEYTGVFNNYLTQMKLSPEDVTVNAKDKIINGQEYHFLVANQAGDKPTPLFIQQQNDNGDLVWIKASPKIGNLIGLEISTSVYKEEGTNNTNYQNVVSNNFNAFEYPQMFHIIQNGIIRPDLIRDCKIMAGDSLSVMWGNFFWSVQQFPEIEQLNPADNPEDKVLVREKMRDYLRLFFSKDSNGEYKFIFGRKPVRLILNHELLGVSDKGNLWYEPSDKQYQALGKNVLGETLLMAMQEATSAGLIPGKDIEFYYGGDSWLFDWNTMERNIKNQAAAVKQARQYVATQLNMNVDDVPYGIAVQIHAYKNGERPHGRRLITTEESMERAFSYFVQEIGKLYLIEVGLDQANSSDAIQFNGDVIQAAHNSKAQGVNFWLGVRNPSLPESGGWFNPATSMWNDSGSGRPGDLISNATYWNLIADIYSLIVPSSN
ncbi:MAG: hypothetical protein AB6733_07190 [Clostridiaceae bacterium]